MTYSHLQVGTSKIPAKPPRGAPPCQEPIVYGANILRDPGVELQLANCGGGGNGDEIPRVGASLPWQWFQAGDACPNPAWATDNADFLTPRRWFVSSTDPRSGTYHARMEGKTSIRDGLSTNYGDRLFAMQFIWCDNPSIDWQWSGRANPGDYVRFGAWAKASTTTGGSHLQPVIEFYNYGATAITGRTSPNIRLTTSYAWYESDIFAPASSYYFNAWISVLADNYASIPTSITVDADDFVLEVQD